MSRVLTPCLPWKSCAICNARMFPKRASAASRAAKLLHQAAQYGRFALDAIDDEDDEQSYVFARSAGRFVTLASQQKDAEAA